MDEFEKLFDTPEARMQLSERLNFVKTARSIFGVTGARRAWATVGLPEILPYDHIGTGAWARLEQSHASTSVGEFLVACTEKAPWGRVRSSDLYLRYCAWMQGGMPAMSAKAFSVAVMAEGIEKKKSDTMWFVGIALKDGNDA